MFMFNTQKNNADSKKKKKSFIDIRKEICLALLSCQNISIFNPVYYKASMKELVTIFSLFEEIAEKQREFRNRSQKSVSA